MPYADPAIIQNPDRLAMLHRLQLLDGATERAFDRLTELASKLLRTPIALVSLVDSDRQFFKSQVGLGEEPDALRETPLSHSFCQHVVATNQPLIIDDARKHPLVHDNLAIPDLNVIAYLGMPITIADGTELGSFCAIDTKPRQWSEWEIEVMRELAASVITEIELRAELLARHEAEERLEAANKALDERNRKLTRMASFIRSTMNHMYTVLERDATKAEILEYLQSAQGELDRQM
jgi:GAF domain-containing protein